MFPPFFKINFCPTLASQAVIVQTWMQNTEGRGAWRTEQSIIRRWSHTRGGGGNFISGWIKWDHWLYLSAYLQDVTLMSRENLGKTKESKRLAVQGSPKVLCSTQFQIATFIPNFYIPLNKRAQTSFSCQNWSGSGVFQHTRTHPLTCQASRRRDFLLSGEFTEPRHAWSKSSIFPGRTHAAVKFKKIHVPVSAECKASGWRSNKAAAEQIWPQESAAVSRKGKQRWVEGDFRRKTRETLMEKYQKWYFINVL